MTDLQYRMLEIYYEKDEEVENSTHSYHQIFEAEKLGVISLVIGSNEKESSITKLHKAGYIDIHLNNGILNLESTSITDLGRIVFEKERANRNSKINRETDLYKAQLENINSTIDTNESIRITNKEIINNTKAQKRLSIATLAFIFIGLIFSILQYFGTTKVTLPQVSKVQILYLDSLMQTLRKEDTLFHKKVQQQYHAKYPSQKNH